MGGVLIVLIMVISITVGQENWRSYDQLKVGDKCVTLNNQPGICSKNRQPCTEPQFHKKLLKRTEYKFVRDSACSASFEKAVCCKIINGDNFKALLPSSPECGITTDNRVIGGEPVGLKDYTWMALLNYRMIDNSTIYLCSGSLISNRYVLTAAHCLVNTDGAEFLNEVRLGEWDIFTSNDCIKNICADKPLDVGTEEIIIHKKYREVPGFQNDIALIRLNIMVQFTEYIKPVCLPMANNLNFENYVNLKLTVVGWGITEFKHMSDKKLFTELPVVSTIKCDNIFERKSGVKLNPLRQLCAGGDGKHDSCRGDSGGPLMYRDLDSDQPSWTIIGIVSFGKKHCGVKDVPAVYTRVDGYIKWILKQIRQ